MPEPTRASASLGRCHACDVKLSPARLRALLRRRALERLIRGRTHATRATQATLAARLRALGFAATRNLVCKDLMLMSAVRLAERTHAVTNILKEKNHGQLART
jgi:arginine repressor